MPALLPAALEAQLSIHGISLQIVAEDAALCRTGLEILGPFRAPVSEEPAARLELRFADLDSINTPPAGLELRWEGDLPLGSWARQFAGPGERCLLLPDLLQTRIHQETLMAEVLVAPGAERFVYDAGFLPAFYELFRIQRRHFLHAACLAPRDRADGAALVMFGESTAGKSTSALALAHAGLDLVTDDLVTVEPCGPAGGPPRLWALPRGCKARDGALKLLPWLDDLPLVRTSRAGCHYLDRRWLGTDAERVARTTYRPALLLFLERYNPVAHRLTRLSPTEALLRIAQANVQPIGAHDTGARAAFAAAAELVRYAPSYALSAGPQLDELAATLLPCLE